MPKKCVLLAAAVLLAASPAGAITISGVSATLGAGNSPDTLGSNNSNVSLAEVLDSGGTVADAVSASVSAGVRYAANAWADKAAFTSEHDIDLTHEYDIMFTVTADPGIVYDVQFNSILKGLIVTEDDDSFGYAKTQLHEVTVTLGSVVQVDHGTSKQLLALDYYDSSQAFAESGTSTLTDQTGTIDLNFNVSFTSKQYSWTDESGLLLGLDEANSPFFTDVSDNSVHGRTAADDGHFFSITASVTAVPEPSAALLLATGLVILAARRRRG